MAISKSLRNKKCQSGFALIETMIAIFILAVGLLGAAALLAQLSGNSTTSRYMSTEALLASEKLDDLNRLPPSDPAIAITSGNSAGSLISDKTDTVTVGATSQSVAYFDTVQISSGDGAMVETVTGVDAAGNATFQTITHSPDGTVTPTNTAPAPAADMLVFKRRWIIDQNVPGLPVSSRRITVLVSLQNSVKAANFQSSMVR